MNETKKFYIYGHYQVNLTIKESVYNTLCYLSNVRNDTENGANDTLFVYSDVQSATAGIFAVLISMFGILLNLMIIVALLKHVDIMKEDFTRFVISLAFCDLAFSTCVLPFNAARFLLR